MDDETDFDVAGPGGTVEGAGLDSTTNTADVLQSDIREALAEIERGDADPVETLTAPKLAALARSLEERPHIAKYLAQRVGKRRSASTPDAVDGVIESLALIGLDDVAPEFAAVLEAESSEDNDQ